MIRLTLEINTVETGGNEFGVGVLVSGEVIPMEVPEREGATLIGIGMAVNEYMRSRGAPEFNFLKGLIRIPGPVPYRKPLHVEERDPLHRECQRQDAMFAHQLANQGGLLNEALEVIDDIGPSELGDRIRYFREHGRPMPSAPK